MYLGEHIEHQRYGRNKDTTINHAYINSGEYRNKFDNISEDIELNRLLYQIAKEMLTHRSGSEYEDMYWIDVETNEIVAKEVTQENPTSIQYSRKTKRKIKNRRGLLTIHSHPYSFPPSIEDFNSNYNNDYGVGVICCHDEKIYIYSANEEVNINYYKMKVEEFLKAGYNDIEAQKKALCIVMQNYDIKYKEV